MVAQGGEPVGRRLLVTLVVLLGLTLLGYALRANNLDAFSFWTDEGLTPERSGYPVGQILRNEILIQGYVTRDTHPPLYYLIIHVTRQLFGASDFAFRYPSVLFGVLLIPLLYQLGQRMGGAAVGLLVALLAAVNPLQVYYSQEARMYTLLVLLVTAMSYVLWQAISQIRNTKNEIRNTEETPSRISYLVSRIFLYGVLAALAVYTHYTAVFLVAAQSLFWAWLLWRGGLKWVIVAALAAAAVAAVPLIPYTIPRLLAGAEANYFYVSPLTMLADVVRFFNLGMTVDFGRWPAVAANVLAVGLLLLGVWGAARYEIRNTRYERGGAGSSSIVRPLFLLVWLLAVVLGLMVGSLLFKPMYQGVRHIMAGSPAFLLLLAFGIWAVRLWASRVLGATRRANGVALAPLVLLLLGAAVSLSNLYRNPDYVKDDFRAIVRFIETRAGARDVVVYNNAVLLPLHEHYRLRPDIAVTALPIYPQMATGAEPELDALSRHYERVWFITDPPADGRDDQQLIRGWLEANLTEVANRTFPARTTVAQAIGYLGLAAPPHAAVAGQLGGATELVGVSFDSPLATPTLWVDLHWRGERPRVNESLLFTLIGPDGREYFREARALLPDDDTRWDENATNRLSYALPLPPGTPPGDYALNLMPESGATLSLGEVTIASTDAWPVDAAALLADPDGRAVRRGPALVWPNGLELAAALPWDEAVRPGNNLPLTLFWRVGAEGLDLEDIRYRLEVIGRDGAVLRAQEGRPGAPWLGRVAGGALLREVTALYFHPATEPGRYRLRWTLLRGDEPIGEPRDFGRVVVEPWPLVTDLPAMPNVVNADFGPSIRLAGYNAGVPRDGLFNVILYWQALAPPGDYLVFLHLVNEAGEIVSQIDAVPAAGTRPTSGWRAREVITDIHDLPVPADLPPGTYHVNVGLYNPDDGMRAAVAIDGVAQADNQLRLATLQLPEDAR